MNITLCDGTVNTTAYKNRPIKYIVVHYTAGTTSKAGTARNTALFFKGGNAGGSADFIVDDGTIVQYNSNIKNRYCWAVGGNKYGSMTTMLGGIYYGKCTNVNSISVEICSNKVNKSKLGAYDTDWYFTEASLKNAAELIKKLMSDYKIGIENVIMHHQVTGKVCPNPWCVSCDRLKGWYDFKGRLTASVNKEVKEEDTEVVETIKVNINGKDYNAARILKNGKNYICLKDLEQAGFEIGYDKETKIPSITNAPREIPIVIDGAQTTIKAVNIKGSNYVPIRSLANATEAFDVSFDTGNVVIQTK